jgi:uncharacterized protein (TIGR00255 family)
MTGFASADGSAGTHAWTWEVRSVNGRSLDLRLRLPPGLETLEPKLRELAAKTIARGSLNATLNLRQTANTPTFKLNEAVLDDLLRAIETVRARIGGPPPTAESLLAHRGLFETTDTTEDEATLAARATAIAATFARALASLIENRAAEGGRLATVMTDQLAGIERIIAAVTQAPARSTDAIALRLREQVQRLLDATGTALDPARLHQEAALLATRADVEEELQRLTSHVAAARELLASPEPVGRKFDFLTQEFNREANTLCSKANAPEITRLGLELKAIIDQMREQVQNIE